MPPAKLFDSYRGLISCSYGDGDGGGDVYKARTKLCDLIIELYEDVFRRLPVVDMPDVDFADLINSGGLCVGLLDPVSNIILNTLSLLPPDFPAIPSSHRPRGPKRIRRLHSRDTWLVSAWLSCQGLIEFMMTYFGFLTEELAGLYLLRTRANLSLAVPLVEHEMYAAQPAFPNPGSARTRSSLRRAAVKADHPAPDVLVRVMAWRFPQERLEAVAPFLVESRRKLTVDNVNAILHLLCCHDKRPPWPPYHDGALVRRRRAPPVPHEDQEEVVTRTTSSDLGDGLVVHTTTTRVVVRVGNYIASLRPPGGMESMLASYYTDMCSDSAVAVVHMTRDDQAHRCIYTQCLNTRALSTIQAFYLKALARLPCYTARIYLRAVLVAGHCYGPMDPVSNILLNSIWYHITFPLLPCDSEIQAHDILDSLSMLRAAVHSMKGLQELICAYFGLSIHEAFKYLCSKHCDFSDELQRPFPDAGSPNLFAAAAAVAKHPQHAALGSFHVSLAPEKLDWLRFLLSGNNGVIDPHALGQIVCILREESSAFVPVLPGHPKLCNRGLSTLSRIRLEYPDRQSSIRRDLEQLLQQYAYQHPWNTLFFAELNYSWKSYRGDNPKPFFCCPLGNAYNGRCYYSHYDGIKILYPDSEYYFGRDIAPGGTRYTEGIIEADFIYYDSQRDVEFAKLVNSHCEPGKKVTLTILLSHGERGTWC